jgi:hypothetical protein
MGFAVQFVQQRPPEDGGLWIATSSSATSKVCVQKRPSVGRFWNGIEKGGHGCTVKGAEDAKSDLSIPLIFKGLKPSKMAVHPYTTPVSVISGRKLTRR